MGQRAFYEIGCLHWSVAFRKDGRPHMQIVGKRAQGGARLSVIQNLTADPRKVALQIQNLPIRPAQSARIFIARNTIEKPPESSAEVIEITCPRASGRVIMGDPAASLSYVNVA
jgi:hypothetical protein